MRIATFFKSKLIKKIWDTKTKFFINTTIRRELDLFKEISLHPQKYEWEILIRYLISSSYKAIVISDAYLEKIGAFCDKFRSWYYT